jgi:hypothetical protein
MRQPCALCAANGKTDCDVLHGVEHVPQYEAFRFAFSRFKQRILIDISKSVEWTRMFLNHQDDYDISIVHLIRDPRGYYASAKRHCRPENWPRLLRTWQNQNNRITDFVRTAGVGCTVAFYDELAANPQAAFPPLVEFLGLVFQADALQYWNHEHHGFAANGASSVILGALPCTNKLQFHVTGDDPFYATRRQMLFHDLRWIHELTDSEKQMIMGNDQIREQLYSFGRAMDREGLSRNV